MGTIAYFEHNRRDRVRNRGTFGAENTILSDLDAFDVDFFDKFRQIRKRRRLEFLRIKQDRQ
jgi:hypothetical protein